MHVFNLPNPSGRTVALRSTRPLREWRPACRPDRLSVVENERESLNASQPFGSSRPVTWVALPNQPFQVPRATYFVREIRVTSNQRTSRISPYCVRFLKLALLLTAARELELLFSAAMAFSNRRLTA
jgi:hypothetical protein